jgi:hypothetical protein
VSNCNTISKREQYVEKMRKIINDTHIWLFLFTGGWIFISPWLKRTRSLLAVSLLLKEISQFLNSQLSIIWVFCAVNHLGGANHNILNIFAGLSIPVLETWLIPIVYVVVNPTIIRSRPRRSLKNNLENVLVKHWHMH